MLVGSSIAFVTLFLFIYYYFYLLRYFPFNYLHCRNTHHSCYACLPPQNLFICHCTSGKITFLHIDANTVSGTLMPTTREFVQFRVCAGIYKWWTHIKSKNYLDNVTNNLVITTQGSIQVILFGWHISWLLLMSLCVWSVVTLNEHLHKKFFNLSSVFASIHFRALLDSYCLHNISAYL